MADLPYAPKTARSRRAISVFIVAILLVSIGGPASYYLRGESYDERFAWRMFSGKRAERCAVKVIETAEVAGATQRRALPLTRIIHKAWESGLKRLRPDIMEALFDKRCEDPSVRSLQLIRRCRRADGSPKPNDEVHHTCALRVTIP